MGMGASNVASNMLNYTANIQPNVVKNQGDSIRVMVARDLDFSTVYSLQKVNHDGG
jgi:type IV secretion system protein VirB10